jgi:hypothetical protein
MAMSKYTGATTANTFIDIFANTYSFFLLCSNAKAKGGPKDKNAADQRGAGNQHGDEDDDVEEEEGESQGEDDDDDDEDDGR